MVTEAFIVPQELPSILSLVYSNIPPIKKGTDSRVGFGYRFGDHADFQIQFELGPQKETQPIASAQSPSKRYIQSNDESQLQRIVRRQESRPTLESYETTTSKGWLQSIFEQFRNNFLETTTTEKPQPITLRRVPMISSSAYRHLQKLYSSARVNLDTRENEIDSVTIESSSSGQHLPKAAIDILQGNRSENQVRNNNNNNNANSRSKEKIDSITRDLSNVDLD
ncbi:hypothetical protein PVAND_005242 [Polypedilum vanderplanki]|uniref:Uncharacterized protein n=1 Tax=Polypedilum vanderplanki TaxID=319348 RepID=A0A9J6BZK7_POLVA|nr:hypothetical protein PVAND_005242 [Polypedilum vanderplanki]